MNTNFQTKPNKQKLSKKLKNILTLSLLAASMVSLAPATALANTHQPAPDLFDGFGVEQAWIQLRSAILVLMPLLAVVQQKILHEVF